ncbi:hypothetical protein SDC9_208252 [bioreactor metagenome]|uniref:Uncharacterized protein n=1 Tax=bioreactor metagenome TaxID=1076179 RepID=A0A645JJL1_9ZZZZ
MFSEGNVGAGVCGIVLAAVLAFVGYSKNKKAKQAAEDEARKRAEEEARKADFAAKHGVLSLAVAGVTFDNRQRILASLYKDSDGIGINGTLEGYEYEGAPACRVYAENEIIGDIRKSDLPTILPVLDKVEDVTLTIDNFADDGSKIYNAVARVVYAK